MSGLRYSDYKRNRGAGYVQNAVTVAFGSFGPILITVCMVLFAFSTLIGNFFYVDNCLIFIHKKNRENLL